MKSLNDVKTTLITKGVLFFVNEIAKTVKYNGTNVNGVEKYYELKNAYSAWDGTYGRNEFCDRFKNFYAMDGRLCTKEYFESFFGELNAYKNGKIPATSFGNGMDIFVLVANKLYADKSLYRKNPVHQCSFISKLVHTLYDEFPIYDSKIRKTLELDDISLCKPDQKIQKSKNVLMGLKDLYDACEKDAAIHGFVDDVYGTLIAKGNITQKMCDSMSFVKKLDFVLWCL